MLKPLKSISFIIAMAFISCHVGIPHDDITIINKSTDSLYSEIVPFDEARFPIKNPAYEKFTDEKNNKIGYQLEIPDFNPGETIHPFLIDTTWKMYATAHHGISIVLFKKDIKNLQRDHLRAQNVIFRRYNLTPKQLDSMKYTITVK